MTDLETNLYIKSISEKTGIPADDLEIKSEESGAVDWCLAYIKSTELYMIYDMMDGKHILLENEDFYQIRELIDLVLGSPY